jgi:uncharacterized protein with von Willebrand factor type A (vWA) domain
MNDTAERLARLGAALRAEGVATSLRDELDAASALGLVDREDREEVKAVLRIALKIPRDRFEAFDRVVSVFWGHELEPRRASPPRPRAETPPIGRGRLLHWDPDARRMGEGDGAAPEGGEEPGYSPEAVLRRKHFDESWSPRDLATIERLLRRLARRLASRPSRRLVPTRGRGRPDLRSSHRRALRTQGEPLSLARRARRVEQAQLVFLLDTSGSMDSCSRFLLSFVLSLRRAAPRAFAFAFNTELVDITRSLAPGKLRLTLERLAQAVPDWSGGTRIGESLAQFVRDHLRRTVDAKTVVVVVSDGLDRGDPALLAGALQAIRRRARKLIWLNPLLGDPRYRPEARGMQAALPYVDHLAAAHDFASLERALPRLLG